MAFGLFAAACGGSSDSGDDNGASPPAAGGDDPGPDTTEPVRGGTLVYAVEADTNSPWDPTKMLCAAACHSTVGRTVFEPLVMITSEGEFVPYLLESMTPNDDFTSWDFKIREGIKFHDGTDVDGDAVAFNLERQRSSLLVTQALSPITEVKSDGALTVTITVEYPWPDFPGAFTGQAGYLGSPTWEAAADEDSTLAIQPVGTGPFKFDSYEAGENGNFKASRFDDYWRGDGPNSVTDEGLPYLDGIDVRFIPSGEARSSGVVNGDLDLIQTSSALEAEDLEKESNIDLLLMDDPLLTETSYLLLQHQAQVGDPPAANPVADLRVRQALAFSIDYEQFNKLRAPNRPLANGLMAPGQDGHLDDTGLGVFDLQKAKDAVADYEAENGPLTVAYKTTTDPASLDTAEVLKSMWEQSGMTVSIDQVGQGGLIGEAIGGNFQVFGWRNHASTFDTQYIWWTSEMFKEAPLPLNFGRIDNPDIDELMLESRQSSDKARKVEIAEEVNQIMADNIYNIPTSWTYWAFAQAKNVHGSVGTPTPEGAIGLNVATAQSGVVSPIAMFKTAG